MQKRSYEMPDRVKDMVGTKQKLSGCLFSRGKDLPEEEYLVIEVRFGTALIMDMNTLEYKHPTFDMLVRNRNMKRAQWARSFPLTEIDLSQFKDPEDE